MSEIIDEDDCTIVKLSKDSGALIFRPGGLEMIIPKFDKDPEEDPEFASEVQAGLEEFKNMAHNFPAATFDEIVNVMSYLMYALERDDWKETFVKELEVILELATKKRIEDNRSHLRLVKDEDEE